MDSTDLRAGRILLAIAIVLCLWNVAKGGPVPAFSVLSPDPPSNNTQLEGPGSGDSEETTMITPTGILGKLLGGMASTSSISPATGTVAGTTASLTNRGGEGGALGQPSEGGQSSSDGGRQTAEEREGAPKDKQTKGTQQDEGTTKTVQGEEDRESGEEKNGKDISLGVISNTTKEQETRGTEAPAIGTPGVPAFVPVEPPPTNKSSNKDSRQNGGADIGQPQGNLDGISEGLPEETGMVGSVQTGTTKSETRVHINVRSGPTQAPPVEKQPVPFFTRDSTIVPGKAMTKSDADKREEKDDAKTDAEVGVETVSTTSSPKVKLTKSTEAGSVDVKYDEESVGTDIGHIATKDGGVGISTKVTAAPSPSEGPKLVTDQQMPNDSTITPKPSPKPAEKAVESDTTKVLDFSTKSHKPTPKVTEKSDESDTTRMPISEPDTLQSAKEKETEKKDAGISSREEREETDSNEFTTMRAATKQAATEKDSAGKEETMNRSIPLPTTTSTVLVTEQQQTMTSDDGKTSKMASTEVVTTVMGTKHTNETLSGKTTRSVIGEEQIQMSDVSPTMKISTSDSKAADKDDGETASKIKSTVPPLPDMPNKLVTELQQNRTNSIETTMMSGTQTVQPTKDSMDSTLMATTVSSPDETTKLVTKSQSTRMSDDGKTTTLSTDFEKGEIEGSVPSFTIKGTKPDKQEPAYTQSSTKMTTESGRVHDVLDKEGRRTDSESNATTVSLTDGMKTTRSSVTLPAETSKGLIGKNSSKVLVTGSTTVSIERGSVTHKEVEGDNSSQAKASSLPSLEKTTQSFSEEQSTKMSDISKTTKIPPADIDGADRSTEGLAFHPKPTTIPSSDIPSTKTATHSVVTEKGDGGMESKSKATTLPKGFNATEVVSEQPSTPATRESQTTAMPTKETLVTEKGKGPTSKSPTSSTSEDSFKLVTKLQPTEKSEGTQTTHTKAGVISGETIELKTSVTDAPLLGEATKQDPESPSTKMSEEATKNVKTGTDATARHEGADSKTNTTVVPLPDKETNPTPSEKHTKDPGHKPQSRMPVTDSPMTEKEEPESKTRTPPISLLHSSTKPGNEKEATRNSSETITTKKPVAGSKEFENGAVGTDIKPSTKAMSSPVETTEAKPDSGSVEIEYEEESKVTSSVLGTTKEKYVTQSIKATTVPLPLVETEETTEQQTPTMSGGSQTTIMPGVGKESKRMSTKSQDTDAPSEVSASPVIEVQPTVLPGNKTKDIPAIHTSDLSSGSPSPTMAATASDHVAEQEENDNSIHSTTTPLPYEVTPNLTESQRTIKAASRSVTAGKEKETSLKPEISTAPLPAETSKQEAQEKPSTATIDTKVTKMLSTDSDAITSRETRMHSTSITTELPLPDKVTIQVTEQQPTSKTSKTVSTKRPGPGSAGGKVEGETDHEIKATESPSQDAAKTESQTMMSVVNKTAEQLGALPKSTPTKMPENLTSSKGPLNRSASTSKQEVTESLKTTVVPVTKDKKHNVVTVDSNSKTNSTVAHLPDEETRAVPREQTTKDSGYKEPSSMPVTGSPQTEKLLTKSEGYSTERVTELRPEGPETTSMSGTSVMPSPPPSSIVGPPSIDIDSVTTPMPIPPSPVSWEQFTEKSKISIPDGGPAKAASTTLVYGIRENEIGADIPDIIDSGSRIINYTSTVSPPDESVSSKVTHKTTIDDTVSTKGADEPISSTTMISMTNPNVTVSSENKVSGNAPSQMPIHKSNNSQSQTESGKASTEMPQHAEPSRNASKSPGETPSIMDHKTTQMLTPTGVSSTQMPEHSGKSTPNIVSSTQMPTHTDNSTETSSHKKQSSMVPEIKGTIRSKMPKDPSDSTVVPTHAQDTSTKMPIDAIISSTQMLTNTGKTSRQIPTQKWNTTRMSPNVGVSSPSMPRDKTKMPLHTNTSSRLSTGSVTSSTQLPVASKMPIYNATYSTQTPQNKGNSTKVPSDHAASPSVVQTKPVDASTQMPNHTEEHITKLPTHRSNSESSDLAPQTLVTSVPGRTANTTDPGRSHAQNATSSPSTSLSTKDIVHTTETLPSTPSIETIRLEEAMERISNLEDNFSNLLSDLDSVKDELRKEQAASRALISELQESQLNLRNFLRHEVASIRFTLDQEIYLLGERISAQYTNVTSQMKTMETELKKTPSASPPGDLSHCRYSSVQRGAPLSQRSTATPWAPQEEEESRDWVITGMECSTRTGDKSYLEKRQHPFYFGVLQFRCVCIGGTENGAMTRYCTMHMWECPKSNIRGQGQQSKR